MDEPSAVRPSLPLFDPGVRNGKPTAHTGATRANLGDDISGDPFGLGTAADFGRFSCEDFSSGFPRCRFDTWRSILYGRRGKAMDGRMGQGESHMTKCLPLLAVGLLAAASCGCAGAAGGWGSGPSGHAPVPTQTAGSRVVVYNIQRTFRCICNVVGERMARRNVEEAFPADVAAGRIEWRNETYEHRPDLVQRYGLKTGAIVVACVVDGRDVSHRTLDRVCELYLKPEQFRTYVTGEVIAALAELKSHVDRSCNRDGHPRLGSRRPRQEDTAIGPGTYQ